MQKLGLEFRVFRITSIAISITIRILIVVFFFIPTIILTWVLRPLINSWTIFLS